MGVLARSDTLFSAWRAGVLSFASPKESSQRKGDPSVGAGQARFLALLGRPGGWLNSPATQTTPADCTRPACVAQRLSRGPERRPCLTIWSRKLTTAVDRDFWLNLPPCGSTFV